MAFLGTVVSLPVPTSCFSSLDPSSSLSSATELAYNPSPPSLSSLLENTLPSVLSKESLAKALHNNSVPLVKHCVCLTISKCLNKFEEVRQSFQHVERILEEDAEFGQWSRRRIEYEKEMKRRVPNFHAIVQLSFHVSGANAESTASSGGSMSQKSGNSRIPNSESSNPPNRVLDALLNEIALRLMWQYHRSLPSLAMETRFNPGQLVRSLTVDHEKDQSTDGGTTDTTGLSLVGSLHVLRLLQESDQFSWSGKGGLSIVHMVQIMVNLVIQLATSHTHLYHIFLLYLKTPAIVLRQAATSLIKGVLSRSPLFEHDPDEVELWLDSLPRLARSPTAKSPEDVPLTDERISVLTFLDDSIRQCLSTPYLYLEKSLAIFKSLRVSNHDENSVSVHNREVPSPLFPTVLERIVLKAKEVPPTLSSSDILALVTYMRRLSQSFARKHSDSRISACLIQKVIGVFSEIPYGSMPDSLRAALSRESRLLGAALPEAPSGHHPATDNTAASVDNFLTSLEDSTGTGSSDCYRYLTDEFSA